MPFSFLNPGLLWGAAIASAPIIIHLLHRRRFKIVRWAAIKFLLASQKKNNRRIKLEHLIILLIRVLVLLLVALAIAQPFLKTNRLAALTLVPSERHVILLVDRSFSMAQLFGSQSAFDQVREGARQIIDTLNDGDKISLLAFSDQPEWIVREPSYNFDSVRAELGKLNVAHRSTDVISALCEAAGVVAKSKTAKREVYLFTDLQSSGWNTGQISGDAGRMHLLRQLGKEATVFLVDAGGTRADNVSVAGIRVLQETVLVGEVTSFEASLRNYSSDPANVVADFYVDRLKQGTKAVSIPIRGKAQVRFDHAFGDSQSHVIRIQLASDRLSLDDSRNVAVKAKEHIKILCVDGKAGPDNRPGETRYLAAALSPTSDRDAGLPMQPQIISPFQLNPSSFFEADTVVLTNVGRLTDEVTLALDSYVRAGGGVIIFSGDQMDRAFYNEHLFKDGNGILPGQLEEVVKSNREGQQYFFLQPEAYDHPILRMFRGLGSAPLSSPIIFDYVKVTADKESKVVCPLNSGSPGILEKHSGLGSCLFFPFTADTDWTNLPKKPVFLPILYESILHLVRNVDPRANVGVGEVFRRILHPKEYAAKFTVARLDGSFAVDREEAPSKVSGTPAGAGFLLSYEQTEKSGVYRVSSTAADEELASNYFCVNLPDDESDLVRVMPDSIKAALPDFEFHYVKDVTNLKLETAENRNPRGIWKHCLWAVLVLVCIESILAHRFGK
ncbi:MAG: BatA domain-containing protein [Planctomycetota bacterium]|nr:BatA domain-containing protein [Planctomycetota bacterium]